MEIPHNTIMITLETCYITAEARRMRARRKGRREMEMLFEREKDIIGKCIERIKREQFDN